ncbi:lytic transglycosylase domain-containing protein [Dyella dinghuensis]|uniref:Lytic transglycosylase domain-containing protein n=2 Tax=Dyella dinghuensis TaxID=1920169 RepID=A0A3S0PHP2_9GAMM|nr:lytic transglycosylase domain-containing protein [Dyella dinghuensis]
MMGCQNLAVPAEIMQHIVNVESSTNPYAIGVVGGELVRQPQNLDEALATVQMLDAKGYNFSLGLAQVNRNNLAKYGITTYEQAFQPCANLVAASQILAECYASANGDWGKSFSCYYSGNFVTGYRDGYVQKIYDSISRSMKVEDARNVTAAPIQLVDTQPASRASNLSSVASQPDTPAYRVAIRSSNLMDTAMAASMAAATTVPTPSPEHASSAASTATAPASQPNSTADADVFVPQVHGPNDPPSTSSASQQAITPSTPSTPNVDRADLREGTADAAFVF